MKKRTNILAHSIVILMMLLWIPVVLDKVINFTSFRYDIFRQPISYGLAYTLIYSLPVLELLAVLLLISTRYRKAGFILSAILMAVFTGYIGLALLGAWSDLPCGCGSVISSLTWHQHLWFNLFFLALSIWGYYLHRHSKSKEVTNEQPHIHSHKIKSI